MKIIQQTSIVTFLTIFLLLPLGVSAATLVVSVPFTNPIGFTSVDNLLTSLLNSLQGIIVVISIIFIVIGAILYITSAGDEKRITTAKAAITASMIGLAIGVAAPSFLKEIYIILKPTGSLPTAVVAAPSIATIALNTLNFLLGVVGVITIIMLVVGGIMYLTSAGNENKIDTAKKIVKWSIVGIAITLAALVFVKQIASFF